MNSCPSRCKEAIRLRASEEGAFACGFASADVVDTDARELYDAWIAGGKHGEMQYCEKYIGQRSDPGMLLPGARTVICCAFNYHHPLPPSPMAGRIADYAWGDDYHYAVRQRLARLGEYVTSNFGGECRALVDTAPMRERYWAAKAGLGIIGINNQLIVHGAGSYFFLGELLWTGTVPPDAPATGNCRRCMACVRACPGNALDGKGGCDARRCVSYLTIEHRGDLPDGCDLGGNIYGCDICQRVCPHNAGHPVSTLPEFQPAESILRLTPDEIDTMTGSHYKKLVAHSAMRRVPLAQLRRNMHAPQDGPVKPPARECP